MYLAPVGNIDSDKVEFGHIYVQLLAVLGPLNGINLHLCPLWAVASLHCAQLLSLIKICPSCI